MHESDYKNIAKGGFGPCRTFQGKSLFGMERKDKKIDRLHGYSAGRIELSEKTASLEIWPRQALSACGEWKFMPDYLTYNLTDDPSDDHTAPETLTLLKEYSGPSIAAGTPDKDVTIEEPLPLTLIIDKDLIVSLITETQTAKSKVELEEPVKETILLFQRWLGQKLWDEVTQIPPWHWLPLMGKLLFCALFNGNVLRMFKSCLACGRRLRLKLEFRDAIGLASLPWEYMFYERDKHIPGTYLCIQTDLILSRFLPAPNKVIPLTDKLELLLLVSQPDNDEERYDSSLIQKAIDDRITTNTDRTILTDKSKPQPHIVHFIGQGKASGDGTQREIYWDPNSKWPWQSEDDFVNRFKSEHGVIAPRLVFLQLYQPGNKRYETWVASLSQKLISVGVPFVVALHHRISDLAAKEFAKSFYWHLAETRDVGIAVQEGRKAINRAEAGRFEFGTPVLYLCSDSPLATQPRKEQETGQASDTKGIMTPHGGVPTSLSSSRQRNGESGPRRGTDDKKKGKVDEMIR
jgi:hypothetical protein